MNGVTRIANERQRQIDVKGYTSEHDARHENGELAQAGSYYAMTEESIYYIDERIGNDQHLSFWPFENYPKVDPNDRIGALVKAGALIAAEIDRLLGLEEN